MTSMQRTLHNLLLVAAAALTLGVSSNPAGAATAEDLNREAAKVLQSLYKKNPAAESLSKDAKAILVFPKIVKAGFVFGGSYGEGVLTKNSQFAGYYNSVSGSWGWQAGVESYAYVVFLMSDNAVSYLDRSEGWEFGVGPTVVVMDEGAAKNLSTTTLKKDAYAFILDQKGLMVSLSLEGTKVSRIKKR
ncbi:MAG TPA: lipid-binding SYLF domain-containing protein [Burkholderiales bacterium]|nr:lipid-binding SYLF domain-containing protein [Burkholderiales bacterium]